LTDGLRGHLAGGTALDHLIRHSVASSALACVTPVSLATPITPAMHGEVAVVGPSSCEL